jgi:hypothetical protein
MVSSSYTEEDAQPSREAFSSGAPDKFSLFRAEYKTMSGDARTERLKRLLGNNFKNESQKDYAVCNASVLLQNPQFISALSGKNITDVLKHSETWPDQKAASKTRAAFLNMPFITNTLMEYQKVDTAEDVSNFFTSINAYKLQL